MKLNKQWKFVETFPTFSAYVTTYNCLKNGYPILEAIKSFAWVDELIVIDGGSKDGTIDAINALELQNLNVYEIPLDRGNPGKDGVQKAMGKAMCSKDFCIQFDADEICLGDVEKWKRIAKDMEVNIMDLPVYEPFGDICNLRLNKEHNPVKWRIYRNLPEITHGIPKNDQMEVDGKTYSKGMSDGCFPLDVVTQNLYPSKMTFEAAQARYLYTKADKTEYGLNRQTNLVTEVPAVLHLGHMNLHKKIKLFLDEWRFWWADLYNKDPNDLSMFFDKETTVEEAYDLIDKKVEELLEKTPVVKVEQLSKYGDLTNATEGLSV